MLIDTHCHLDFPDFDKDREDCLNRARRAGVTGIIDVGSSIESSRRAVALAKTHEMIYASIGVHPHDAGTVTDKVIADFRELAKSEKVVAIGEVGLDFYRNLSPKEEQKSAFIKFIHLADELDLPLIIHARDAADDTISILNKEKGRRFCGVMHCFSGDKKFLKECLGLGLYISFAGPLTFKNAAALRDVAKEVPVERLLVETDAPFLAPQKYRGQRNEPAYITSLVDEWAAITGLTQSDIARITTHNANELFKLRAAGGAKIAYEIRDSLYLNITNRCTNKCDFCVRSQTDFVKGHNLVLEREPSVEEIISAIGNASRYKEVVFCGYGEPTIRLDAVKAVAKKLKADGVRVRLVTNGHGDLINSRPIAAELAGIIDKVCVSLNAESEEKYEEICAPEFGRKSFRHIIDFIKGCVAAGIEVEATCLDLEGVDTVKCETLAKSLGADFRLRRYGVTG
ncbi:MAG: YchF/TatD family DNA exonuclease [Candidatus Omnitrophica bacterium]|nr:YchF/TatD family DNA exonuclease [Candidatus Omnitrophota bacterium]